MSVVALPRGLIASFTNYRIICCSLIAICVDSKLTLSRKNFASPVQHLSNIKHDVYACYSIDGKAVVLYINFSSKTEIELINVDYANFLNYFIVLATALFHFFFCPWNNIKVFCRKSTASLCICLYVTDVSNVDSLAN